MFAHLHCHTEYSLLDGAAKIKDIVAKAKELNMPALAITDHGTMFGVVDFYKECKKVGIKPILGCEVYVAQRSMSDKTPKIDDKINHLTLLAETNEGYRNLLKIVSLGFIEGFYYKPRVDKKTLKLYNKGIIALSGCVSGEPSALILADKYKEAKNAALEYKNIFHSYFLEIQDHGIDSQKIINQGLLKIHQETGIPFVATNDVHYVNKRDAKNQDILLAIQTGSLLDEPDRFYFSSNELYLKSADEMEVFKTFPGALENTLVIAERCNVDIKFGEYHLPEFPIPDGYTENSYLKLLCYKGLEKRYEKVTEEIKNRLNYELSVIEKMGFSTYFLVVWDFVRYARKNEIPVGPGRGSAAGSLVAYSLGITNIDPLRYNLLFERFLNPNRVTMPDVDIDFCYERRGEVVDYLVNKYGSDKAANIITFGTMAARGVIRDVGRVMNIPYTDVDKIAKLIPADPKITIGKALAQVPELNKLYENPEIKELIDTASALEGIRRHASTHAAGVVITKNPLTDYLPLYKPPKGSITTQFDMNIVEELGLLKIDILGLKTLTVINDTLKYIENETHKKIDIEQIPMDNRKTYEMLSQGKTLGVFQLEGGGMRAVVRKLKPENFNDLIALVALYRPGPLGSGMVDDFINRKHGLETVDYLHPKLKPILKDTYGVIIYQEQVMRIASDVAGLTLAEADMLRRSMGKKKPEIIAGFRTQFIDGAKNNGVDEDIAKNIFDLMEYFAGYGFNVSHSASYAMIAYQTAYLKANYPVQFMAALLTSVKDKPDRIMLYLEECRKMGIEILPPDINYSKKDFNPTGAKIRFGLAAIKNVGERAVDMVTAKAPYKSFTDFCYQIDTKIVNKSAVESLIKCGAFDFTAHRAQLLAAIDLGYINQRNKRKDNNLLFELTDELPETKKYSKKKILALEKEIVGFYISGHPLSEYRHVLNEHTNAAEAEEFEGSTVTISGLISKVNKILTRKNDPMAFLTLEDLTGTIEVVVFPKLFAKKQSVIEKNNLIVIEGRISEAKLLAEKISLLRDETIPIAEYFRI